MTSRIAWLASLDVEEEPHHHRKTGIICTIGPKTADVESLNKLRDAGMNIARLNFSHGTHEYHRQVVANIRTMLGTWDKRPVAIALDTKGPEIRTGDLADPAGIKIEAGQELLLTTDPLKRTIGSIENGIFVDYKDIGRSCLPGSKVYIDDGNLQLEVVQSLGDGGVKAKALNGHHLLSRKGVNLPYTDLALPAMSEKDRDDLQLAVELGLDMVFASFIRKAQDILDIRAIVGPDIWIIAKIESHEGVRNFDEILEAADGIMVARGDLGIEIPAHKVFVAQKMMIARCNLVGKPVICATQMLESMTSNPRPTRAEASDVANAVLDGADCVMLSAETARGAYPVETVQMMSRICQEAESTIAYLPLFEELRSHCYSQALVTETVSSSAVNASLEPYIRAIIVLTTSGESAFRVAKFRPQVPIIAVTRNERLARRIHLYRGCFPIHYKAPAEPDWQADVERRLQWGIAQAKAMGVCSPGDHVIVIQGSRMGTGNTNTLRSLPVP
jgi:pyruvate kinase